MNTARIINHVEAGRTLEAGWNAVILRSPDPAELLRAASEAAEKGVELFKLVLTAGKTNGDRFDLASPLGGFRGLDRKIRLEIEPHDHEIERLYLWRPILLRFPTLIVLRKERALLKRVKQVTAMGYGVKIDPSVFFAGRFDRIIDHYFHTPQLRRPVEPVHTLFHTWLAGKGPDLWDLLDETPGGFTYRTEDGRRTLSPRWAEKGIDFSAAESLHLKWELFREREACRTCRAFRICGGIARSSNPAGTCAHIIALTEVFERVQRELAAEVQAALSAGKKEIRNG